jgi:hypothetical protein
MLGNDESQDPAEQLQAVRDAQRRFNRSFTAYAKMPHHLDEGLLQPEVGTRIERFNAECRQLIGEWTRSPEHASLDASRENWT